jgi:hypothetical protein
MVEGKSFTGQSVVEVHVQKGAVGRTRKTGIALTGRKVKSGWWAGLDRHGVVGKIIIGCTTFNWGHAIPLPVLSEGGDRTDWPLE